MSLACKAQSDLGVREYFVLHDGPESLSAGFRANSCHARVFPSSMRKRFAAQIGLGQTPIEKVALPANSRDELPPVLAGLQWIFANPEINEEVFALLEEKVIGDKKKHTGRPGMDLWQLLVLGVIRLALDCDYDRLEHTANYDKLVRAMMGLPDFCDQQQFHHKTISDNVCHVDAELLAQINEIVVRHGRAVIKKEAPKNLRSRSTVTCWRATCIIRRTAISCGTPFANASI